MDTRRCNPPVNLPKWPKQGHENHLDNCPARDKHKTGKGWRHKKETHYGNEDVEDHRV